MKRRLNSPFFEIGPKNYLVGDAVIDENVDNIKKIKINETYYRIN